MGVQSLFLKSTRPWRHSPRGPYQKPERPISEPLTYPKDRWAESPDVERPNYPHLTIGEFRENTDTLLDPPKWEHKRKYVCPCCGKTREEGWHLAQHWDSSWGNDTAKCPVILKSTRIVAYLFQNWDCQSDPGNGDYGRTKVGRLINGLLKKMTKGTTSSNVTQK